MAIITLCRRYHMLCGFTDGMDTIMTLATRAKNFEMIDIRNNVKSERCMAGLAGIACREVVRRFFAYGCIRTVVTLLAIGRQSLMKKRPGWTFTLIGNKNR